MNMSMNNRNVLAMMNRNLDYVLMNIAEKDYEEFELY